MSRIIAMVLLASLGWVSAPALASEDCDFDQAYLAKRIEQIVAHVPGGSSDKNGRATWRLPSGEIVRVAYGGCVDLGVSIEVANARGVKLSTREAVERLLHVASMFWSERDSLDIAAVLADGGFSTTPKQEGGWLFEAPPNEEFPFGFTLEISDSKASIAWQSQ